MDITKLSVREVLDLLDEWFFFHNYQNTTAARDLGNILSALRGPDHHGDLELKSTSTIPIRRLAFPRSQGYKGWDRHGSQLIKIPINSNSLHFSKHVLWAKEALESCADSMVALINRDDVYLTGSKFFVCTGNDTDYFTQFDSPAVDIAKKLRFKLLSNSSYKDSETTEVYRLQHPTLGQIDLQIVNNADKKLKAQSLLKRLGITKPNKEQWEAAYSVS